jgi:hypothetical protein
MMCPKRSAQAMMTSNLQLGRPWIDAALEKRIQAQLRSRGEIAAGNS